MAKASKSTPKVVVVKKKATKAKKSPASGAKKGTAATRIMEAIASQMAIGKDTPERATVQGLAAMPNERSFGTTILNMKNKV